MKTIRLTRRMRWRLHAWFVARTSARTRLRWRQIRALLMGAGTLTIEAARTTATRGRSEPRQEQLRRALTSIAQQLAFAGAELEPMIRAVRCGDLWGRWIREFTPVAERGGSRVRPCGDAIDSDRPETPRMWLAMPEVPAMTTALNAGARRVEGMP